MEITFNQLLDACTETFSNDNDYDSKVAIRLFAALHNESDNDGENFLFLQDYGYTYDHTEETDSSYIEAYTDTNGHKLWVIYDYEDREFSLEDEDSELCSDIDYDDFCEAIDRILSED